MIENLIARGESLDRRKGLGKVSGLNWGQRENRNKTKLSTLRGDVRQEGFYPLKSILCLFRQTERVSFAPFSKLVERR